MYRDYVDSSQQESARFSEGTGGAPAEINDKALETWHSLRGGVGIRVKVGAGVWWGNREMWQLSFCYCHEHPRQSLYTERRFIMADIFGGPSLTISWPCCSWAYVRG